MKKKRLFGLLLSLALMLGMMPALGISMPAYAADPVSYDLWVGGIAVTSDNAGNITGATTPTASYDAAARTLTLTDYSSNGQTHALGGGSNAAIYTDLDLTIVLNGKNTVQNTSDGGFGIYAKKNLTIKGSGELTAAGGKNINNCGIRAAGNVVIENGKVTAEGNYAICSDKMINIKDGEITANGVLEGIYAYSSLLINDGKVTATATATGSGSSAICSDKDVTINGGEVTATATSDNDISYGILGDDKVTISGGTVKATAKSNNTSDNKNSYGIHSSSNNVTISSGVVTADAVSAGGYSYGISSYSQNVKISGGNVTASAASGKSGESHGIWSEFNDVEISGGKVTASAASESGKSYGIGAIKNIRITGGEVTAEATSDANHSSDNHSLGISAYESNVTISGGTVTSTATVKSGSGKGYGIIAGKIVTISSGTVKSTATANSDSYGIYAEYDDVFFDGGDVTASGKKAVYTLADKKVDLGDGVIVKAGANAGSATDVTSTFAKNHDQAWAHIMEAVCIVSFDANGHGKAPAAQIIANGGKVTKPEDPSEGGWTFDGWYKEKKCVNAWNFDTDTVTRTMTLYAKWKDDSTEDVKKVVDMISALPAPER